MKYAPWNCQAEYMDGLVDKNDAGESAWTCVGEQSIM
jgi:hypothetical protein